MALFQTVTGPLEFKHEDGTISLIRVELAGIGLKKVRVANLPPKMPNGILQDALSKYGDIKRITDEHWSNRYRYRTESGIRLVEIHLRKRIPSHMSLGGPRVLMSYESQPATCYGCSGPGHQCTECPALRKPSNRTGGTNMLTWADVVHGEYRKLQQ
jgi:hypothetical protein